MYFVYRVVVLFFILIKILLNCIIFILCGFLVDLLLIFYWLCKVVSINNVYIVVCVCGVLGWEMFVWYCYIIIIIMMINDYS